MCNSGCGGVSLGCVLCSEWLIQVDSGCLRSSSVCFNWDMSYGGWLV